MSEYVVLNGHRVCEFAFMLAAANGTKVTETGMPDESEDDSSITPEDTVLFMRQVAADNTSVVVDYSSWSPQASHEVLKPVHHILSILVK